MRMPRDILLVVSSMNGGGAERVAATLANAWAERGDAVTLLITYSGRGECAYPLSGQVKVAFLAETIADGNRGEPGYRVRFMALRNFIRRSHAMVIVSFLTHVNIAVILAAAGLRRRVLASERSYPPAVPIGWTWNLLRRLTYPAAFRVVVQTAEALRWLHARIPGAKGAAIANPVTFPLPDTEPVLPPNRYIAAQRRLLLAVGRLDEGKQFDRLLDAFAALAPRHPSWDLAILGEGPERAGLELKAAESGVRERLVLPGRAGNVSAWYDRADLFVLTSRFEGFPNSLAEAMAHGTAAVSYDCDTGPRDIIRHERDGLLVTPVGDVPALTRALDRLMGDDAERMRMAALATQVRERYSLQATLAQWDRAFGSSP